MRLWPFHTRRQVTGLTLSVTGVGVTWTNTPSDRDIARDVLAVIEDHRSFYAGYRSGARYFVVSIDDVRRYLRGPIEQCRSDELRNALRGIQAATREFITRIADDAYTPVEYQHARLDEALASLRALVGLHVANIAERFDLPIDGDLTRLFPTTELN